MIKLLKALSILYYTLIISCAPITTYEMPIQGYPFEDLILSEKVTATTETTKIGSFVISKEDAMLKLIEENPGYDVVINPVYKKRIVKNLFIFSTEMVRVEARLGKYKKN